MQDLDLLKALANETSGVLCNTSMITLIVPGSTSLFYLSKMCL